MTRRSLIPVVMILGALLAARQLRAQGGITAGGITAGTVKRADPIKASTAQAIAILMGLRGLNVVGADVVEVAPAYDSAQVTALAAAHIGFLMLSLFAEALGR